SEPFPGKQALDQQARRIQPPHHDVVGPPALFEEATEGPQRDASDLVLHRSYAESALCVQRTEPHHTDEVRRLESRTQLHQEYLSVDLEESAELIAQHFAHRYCRRVL